MRRIFPSLALLFAAVLFHGAGQASAASLSDAQALAQAAGNAVVKAGDCLDEGCDDDYRSDYRPRAHVYEEEEEEERAEIVEEDEPVYRKRAYRYHSPRPKSYNAYTYGYGHKKRKPHWRKTCVYGPLREKKVCDYVPRVCSKERECYLVHGKKYCRYYTKCKGGDKHCYWIKKRHYGGDYCGEVY